MPLGQGHNKKSWLRKPTWIGTRDLRVVNTTLPTAIMGNV